MYMGMGRVANVLHGLKPAMMMVTVQAALAGVNVFYKLGSNVGMSLRVLIAYRFLIAAVFIVPIALVVERNRRPKLTWTVVGQSFLCGLLGGSMAQNLYAQSLVLTSATFAAAMTNIVPAITFILAIAFGLEKLGLGKIAGKAKVAGTLTCIGGAMLLTFYKGVELNIWSTSVDLLHHKGGHVAASAGNPVLGAFLVVGCCFSSAVSLIIQAKMMRAYPCPYSSTALMMIMGAVQAAVFALCMERSHWAQWKLGWNIRLLAVSYSGIVGSGLTFTLMAWCVQMKGPLFVSVFNPLMLVLVAIAGSLLLNEKLHLGSVIGAVIIVCGLYIVLWGKGKEMNRLSRLVPTEDDKKSGTINIIVTTSTDNNNLDDNKSGKIDIIVTTSTENNNLEESTRSNSSIAGIIPNGIAGVPYGDSFDFETSEETMVEEKEEEKFQEGGDSKINADV